MIRVSASTSSSRKPRSSNAFSRAALPRGLKMHHPRAGGDRGAAASRPFSCPHNGWFGVGSCPLCTPAKAGAQCGKAALEFWAPAFAGVHIPIANSRSLPTVRHPGLDPGSRFLRHRIASTESGTPDQVRGDEKGLVGNRSFPICAPRRRPGPRASESRPLLVALWTPAFAGAHTCNGSNRSKSRFCSSGCCAR
jgi:hypothetical protein